jgi:hypothetical protein
MAVPLASIARRDKSVIVFSPNIRVGTGAWSGGGGEASPPLSWFLPAAPAWAAPGAMPVAHG